MKQFIKNNQCPINAIAENISHFQGKQVTITQRMMDKLVDEARDIDAKNVKTTKLNDNETKYDVVIPGEITTKLSMVLIEGNGPATVALLSVEAEDIPGLKLNTDYNLCPGYQNAIHFDYENEEEQ